MPERGLAEGEPGLHDGEAAGGLGERRVFVQRDLEVVGDLPEGGPQDIDAGQRQLDGRHLLAEIDRQERQGRGQEEQAGRLRRQAAHLAHLAGHLVMLRLQVGMDVLEQQDAAFLGLGQALHRFQRIREPIVGRLQDPVLVTPLQPRGAAPHVQRDAEVLMGEVDRPAVHTLPLEGGDVEHARAGADQIPSVMECVHPCSPGEVEGRCPS